MPSLNALRAFHAVACLRSVTAAASELGVTPSAVSRQIRNLEESFGIALVVRERRGMRLTADGRALESELADAFTRIADAVERMRQPARGELLRVVVSPMFASCWLLPRMERFSALRPETEVVLIDTPEKIVATNRMDLAISWGRFREDSTMMAERLSDSEEAFPVCRSGALAGDGLAGSVLLHYEIVGNSWGWPDWPEFIRAVGLSSAELTDGPRLSPALLLDAVRRGRGVMLSNNTLAHDDLAAGRLVRPIPESMQVDQCYWLLTARAARNRPEVQAFCGWLREEFDVFSKRSHRIDE